MEFSLSYPYNFELERIVEHIKENRARRVGIQLPEGVKSMAIELADAIAARTGAEVIISGNSCYGACDIDDKLLKLVDILFHFGHTRAEFELPGRPGREVCFIELRSEVEVKPAVNKAIEEIRGEQVCVVTTVQHVHRLKEAMAVLAQEGKEGVTGKSPRLRYEGQVLGCDFSAAKMPCDEILFIGSGSFHPAGIALYTGMRVVAADPFTTQLRVFYGEEERKRRYIAIARAWDASTFGIILGLKSGQCNPGEARRLKEEAIRRGLNAYLIAMDEITEDGLLGYKVDAFVNTACPRLVEDFLHLQAQHRGDKQLRMLSAREFEVVIGRRKWEELYP